MDRKEVDKQIKKMFKDYGLFLNQAIVDISTFRIILEDTVFLAENAEEFFTTFEQELSNLTEVTNKIRNYYEGK